MSERMSIQRQRSGWEHAGRSWSIPARTLSGGQPLEAGARTSMERSFGHDFSQVRVHADEQAAAAAAAIDAAAYTIVPDIVFGSGRYEPETAAGRELLGHELTHVVQQATGTAGSEDAEGPVVLEDAGLERAAHEQGARAARAEPASAGIDSGTTASVQRQAIQREGEGDDGGSGFPWGSLLPFVGQGVNKLGSMMGAPGIGGMLVGPLAAASGFSQGGVLGDTKGVGGVMTAVGGAAKLARALLAPAEGAGEGAAAGAAAEGGAGLLGAAEALGPIGAVIGAGVGGVQMGQYLNNHTEVGEDTQDSLGGIDRLLGGDPEHGKSAIVSLDDYRQEQWDQGGLGYLKGTGAALGEAALGTAGAIGGLAEGAAHGVESIGKKVWDWL